MKTRYVQYMTRGCLLLLTTAIVACGGSTRTDSVETADAAVPDAATCCDRHNCPPPLLCMQPKER